ncbi:multiheme c-type cytochrome [Urbifossiella limnaea]|uniref:Cytochrome c-552/4 domain-containing protein n=1 Tax=Urbifossiella limnaea TaxID=2528023 RepID=A0A517XR10_9BACT|nr:multiheme c-type cytochrome [Urbifossiella limnaea]QDU19943.1 hypothetical protein ETAA1_18830 [Urbifossiella limnaea]
MTRTGSVLAVFAPAVLVTAACWATVRPAAGVQGTATTRPEDKAVPAVVGRAVGQGGCSSVGCHGAPGSDVFRTGPTPTSWASSALVWAAADPHRRAYVVLDGELATKMMIALTGEASPGVPKVKATAEARCLACHTNPTLATNNDPHAVSLRAEGVSCEACHGNASGWLQSHTGFTAPTRPAGYDAGGMSKLYELGERALACVGCHVGAPAGNGLPLRDMNHDMIAAGHPRLNFDFATYQFILPKHWYERDRSKPESRPDPDFETRAWLIGRVAHAEAACKLTADRAKRADPWPEFAEYSCVACHHRIGDSGAAYPAPNGRPLGSVPWQPIWPVDRMVPSLSSVRTAMRGPRPNAGAEAAATRAAAELAALRASGTAFAREWFTKALPAGEWDRDLTEQVYHGAAAFERSKATRDPAAFAAAAKLLTLPRGTVRFDLPPGAADAVRALVR